MSGCHKPEHNSTQRAKVDDDIKTDYPPEFIDALRYKAALDENGITPERDEQGNPWCPSCQAYTQKGWHLKPDCPYDEKAAQRMRDELDSRDYKRLIPTTIVKHFENIIQRLDKVEDGLKSLRGFYGEYGHRLLNIENAFTEKDRMTKPSTLMDEIKRLNKWGDKLQNRIVELEKGNDALSPEAFGVLLKRIESLQSENDTHCSAITALEDSNRSLKELIKNLIEQNVKKYASLEDELKAKLIAPMCDVSREVFTKMYPNVSQTESYVMPSKGKPHKCPLCHAAGIVFDVTNAEGLPYPNSNKIKCPPCDGSGIVWG